MNDKCPAVMAGHLTRPSHMLAKYIYMLIPTDFARIYAVQALEGERE